MVIKLRNGIFLAPFHPLDEDPTLCIHRDLELIEHLDRLGYEEAWIGEHHSAGFEIIASPEVFIAAAAERTRSIKLGTGVVSLPYHSPLTTANRIIQLDHQTRGRVMFGVGPGLLPSDAFQLGVDPSTLWRRRQRGGGPAEPGRSPKGPRRRKA
jgi:limonene 1,2-monooxygenase